MTKQYGFRVVHPAPDGAGKCINPWVWFTHEDMRDLTAEVVKGEIEPDWQIEKREKVLDGATS